MDGFVSSLLASVLLASIPLIVAGMGELLAEKSGVLNLGVEGMMLLGAVAAFAVALNTGNAALGMLAGTVTGGLAALLFAFLVLRLLTNQTATGLALTILGTGLSALFGVKYVGLSVTGFAPVAIPFLSELPLLGELFNQSIPAYLGIALCVVFGILLFKSKFGLTVRAVGESPSVAHAIGYDVLKIRYAMTILGGAMAGFAASAAGRRFHGLSHRSENGAQNRRSCPVEAGDAVAACRSGGAVAAGEHALACAAGSARPRADAEPGRSGVV